MKRKATLISTWLLCLSAPLFWSALTHAGLAKGKISDSEKPPIIDKEIPTNVAEKQIETLLANQWDWYELVATSGITVDDQSVSFSLSSKGGFVDGILLHAGEGKRIYVWKSIGFWAEPREWHKRWCVDPHIEPHKKDRLCWASQADANKFVTAINRMIWGNSPEGVAEQEAQRAKHDLLLKEFQDWRLAGSKVDPPQEAQRHYVIAQQAYQDQNLDHAAEELSAALDVYPTWPTAQHDLAAILEKLSRYSEAIRHMEIYLELAPDAPNAKECQQKIWIWQDKIKNGGD
jgi:tetratricopeptide (TPR) repeat protein